MSSPGRPPGRRRKPSRIRPISPFRHLKCVGDGDPETVVPYRQQHRDLQNAHCVDRFPEHALGTAGVSDSTESDLVTIARKICSYFLQAVQIPIEFRCVGEPHKSGHLGTRGRQIGGGVITIVLWNKCPGLVQKPGGKVTRHRPAAESGLRRQIRMGIELGKELFGSQEVQGKHQRLGPGSNPTGNHPF